MAVGNRAFRQSIRHYPHQKAIEVFAVKKGNKRQAKVSGSLKRLKKRKRIVDGGLFPTHSPEDNRGIGGWLLKRDGKKIEFQIKGSDAGAKEHLKKYPEIPVILIRSWESGEEIDKLLIARFGLWPPFGVSNGKTNGISRWPSVAREPIQPACAAEVASARQNATLFLGSNGTNGSKHSFREKYAQSSSR